MEFREKVFSVVRKIPKGNILNTNFDPKIPCHRVIRSDGKLGGYNRGLKSKISKLKLEGYLK